MPVYLIENNLGVWQIDESFDELCARFSGPEAYIPALTGLTSNKRHIERLAARALLKEMLGREVAVNYRDNGAPCLADGSFHISVSHTKNYVAVLLDAEKRVGVDIEQRSEKVVSLAGKFINHTQEYISCTKSSLHLLLHWSGKEAVYKLLGETGVIFSRQLLVKPFEPQKKGVFILEASTSRTHALFQVRYKIEEDFVVTWVQESLTVPYPPGMGGL